MSKKHPNKTITPLFIKGSPLFGIDPFTVSSSQIPFLKIDTEAHFSVEKKVAPNPKMSNE